MIRVLHISTPTSWRGGEQQLYNLALLQHQSNDVQPLVLTPIYSELGKRLKKQGVEVVEFFSAGILKLPLAAKIASVCKSQAFDIIHTHDSHAHTAAVMAHTFFGITLPLVVHRRVDFAVSNSPLSNWKYNHQAVKRIITVSAMIRDITAPSLKRSDILKVIHSGVDPLQYAIAPEGNVLRDEYAIPDDVLLVGNLSALADHKDYPTFLRTVQLLKQRGLKAKYFIVGDGPEKQKIQQLSCKSGLEQDVILTGFRKDVVKVMQSLDVFLMTSKTEGLGTILIEALFAGIPVVATRAGGIPELIKHGETGLLCPIGDHECLADAVERITSDKHLSAEIIRRARTFAQHFSHEQTAAKTLALYHEVLHLA